LRILWIKTSPLHPLTRGGDLRTFNILKQLHRRHEVTFVGMIADVDQELGSRESDQYSTQAVWVREPKTSLKLSRMSFMAGAVANILSSLPYAVSRFRSSALQETLGQLLKTQKFDVMICDFLFPAASLPWEMRAGCGFPWVLFQHNVESMIWARRCSEMRGVSGIYFRSQWRRMLKFETKASLRFDAVLAVSDEDVRIFQNQMLLPNILGSIPTGVDLEFFQMVPKTAKIRPTVVFMGSMDWYANVDAVTWFVGAIWRLIRSRVPEARFVVVGRQPPPAIRDLSSEADGIEITGTVPDVRPYLRAAHAMVVPLRVGGGTRLKIFEAMAAEVPVVSTTVGAEGLPVIHGKHILIGDDAESIADAVVSLLCEPKFGQKLSQAALAEIATPNSWDAAAQTMERLLAPILNHEAVSAKQPG
jgi:glycosyltransferase involved in cell wall biosynthesis